MALPPIPRGPVAPLGPRVGARIIDLILAGVAIGIVLSVVRLHDRPIAGLAIALVIMFVYEALTVAAFGTTPGKRAVELRVIALDSTDRPTLAHAARRAAADVAVTATTVVGAIGSLALLVAPLGDGSAASTIARMTAAAVVLIASISGPAQIFDDPLRRGPADRAAGTMVVPDGVTLPIRTRDLPGYTDGAHRPRFTTLGRVADTDVRVRARLRRLSDSPALAALAGILALVAAVVTGSGSTLLLLAVATAVWVAAFSVDEARRLHRRAATAGHVLAGLVVVDRRTGEAPGPGRAAARAISLGLLLYVPLLWPLLGISVVMMRFSDTGRGLHDRLGRTIVVADPRMDPEAQRQRTIAVRLGRAG
ncbi:MAG: hypothetical protein JWM89_3294 [Acidimicrobiales bacterium]|nr:hypothetical protein [Acidimicrobiales bacterium]